MSGCSCNKSDKYKKYKNYTKYNKHGQKSYKKYKKKSYKKHKKNYRYGKPHHYNSSRNVSSRNIKSRTIIQKTVINIGSGNSRYRSLTPDQLKSWDYIHTKARNSITNELKNEFKEYIIYLSYNFPCSACRPHIKTYLYNHPINVSDNILKWSWEFHNDVNVRIKKPLIKWEYILSKY